MTPLSTKVLTINEALQRADFEYAFGGAIALAFHIIDPRGTRDIDINVFVPVDHARAVFEALPPEVNWHDDDIERVRRDGQVRLLWEDTPVDLFFSTHAFHEEALLTSTDVPFLDSEIPILGASELAVFKAFFNRLQDWADIERMIQAGSLDVHRVLGWLVDLLGEPDPRIEQLRSMIPRA
jgi:hypothetical protein